MAMYFVEGTVHLVHGFSGYVLAPDEETAHRVVEAREREIAGAAAPAPAPAPYAITVTEVHVETVREIPDLQEG